MTQKIISNNSVAETRKEFSLYDFVINLLTLSPLRNNTPTVSVLRFVGTIGKLGGVKCGGLSLEDLNPLIEKAFEFKKLAAVCIIINSPGGSPVQSELIANRIINLSKEKKIPVYSFIEDVGASGGYWLACAGNEIYASKSSIIGSIGVVSRGFGFKEAIEKIGIERRVYTSGTNKSILDPFTSAKKEDVDIIKKIQTYVHAHFIDAVKTRRGGKLTQKDNILFNGEFWTGEIAYDYGLIDGIDDFHSFLKHKFGDKINIEYVKTKESWLKKKLAFLSSIFVQNLSAEIRNSLQEIEISAKYDIK